MRLYGPARAPQGAGQQPLAAAGAGQHDAQPPQCVADARAGIRVIGDIHRPTPQQRRVVDGSGGVAELPGELPHALGELQQHAGAQAVGHDLHRRRLRRRGGQGAGHVLQHGGEGGALLVVLQHVQHALCLRRGQGAGGGHGCRRGRKRGRRLPGGGQWAGEEQQQGEGAHGAGPSILTQACQPDARAGVQKPLQAIISAA